MNESRLLIISVDAHWNASPWRGEVLCRLSKILERDIKVREVDSAIVGDFCVADLFSADDKFRPIGEYIAEAATGVAQEQALRVLFLFKGVADARAGAAASELKGLAGARSTVWGAFMPITIQSTETNLGWSVTELTERVQREDTFMTQAKQLHNTLSYVDTLTREHFTPETWKEIYEAASVARYLYFTLDESCEAEVDAAMERLNEALEHAQLKIEGLEKKEHVPNRTLEDILNRYSCRNFGQNPISDEQMEWLRKAALAAPTGMNLCRTHYSFVRDARLLEWVNRACLARARETDNYELLRRIAGRHSSFLYNAPLVIFISAPSGGADDVNAGIGVQNLCLAAESLGLGSCIMGLPTLAFERRDADELKEALGFPENYEFVIAVAIGTKNIAGKAHKWRESQVKFIDPSPPLQP